MADGAMADVWGEQAIARKELTYGNEHHQDNDAR